MRIVITSPPSKITQRPMLAPSASSLLSKSALVIGVSAMPKTCAEALRRPEEVPSDSGYVISAANSKPTVINHSIRASRNLVVKGIRDYGAYLEDSPS